MSPALLVLYRHSQLMETMLRAAASICTALVLAASTVAAAHELEGREVACSAVHIFLARGNNEPYPGRQGTLVDAICSGLGSCDYEDVQYYNPYEADYCDSVHEGAINGVSQVMAYAKRCPNAKLVLSGYSQGAQVIGDVVGGGGGTFFNGCVQPSNTGLDPNTATGNKIAAVLLFGDTRHTASQPYNIQTGADGTGLFPRSGDQLTSLNRFSGVLRSYCVKTDPICAANLGPEVVETHLNYFDIFSNDAADWVKKMVNVEEGASSSTAVTSSAKSSATHQSGSSTGETSTTIVSTTTASPTSVLFSTTQDSSTNALSSIPDHTTSSTVASPTASTSTTTPNDALSVQPRVNFILLITGTLALSLM